MTSSALRTAAILVAGFCSAAVLPAFAASSVERNSNVVGVTQEGAYRGVPGMQDNEPSCAINPLLVRNILCAWNGSGGSDDIIGDTWIRFSESLDGGETFFNRYLNGSAIRPATDLGLEFAADPVMLCWPGGCGTVFIAANRADRGGIGGGIFLQLLPDAGTETGARHLLKQTVDPVYASSGSEFADKPHAIFLLDEDYPGTVAVSMAVDRPDGGSTTIARLWPKGRILVAFAVGDPDEDEIRILSTWSDDYGASWSYPKEISKRDYWHYWGDDDDCDDDDDDRRHWWRKHDSDCREPSRLNQGINLAARGDTVVYAFRRFASGDDPDAIMAAVSSDRGERIDAPFAVVSPLCAYDVPTLPNEINATAAASRTNDFPWLGNDGNKFLLLYSERRPSPGGGCLTDPAAPSDPRIKAMAGSPDGEHWSAPVEVAPNPAHGFQFMPVVECSLGVCQAAWWDTRRDSERTRSFLLAQGDAVALAALQAFESNPLFADFNFATGAGDEVIQFRRTADMYTARIRIEAGVPVVADDPPVLASRYRLGLLGGVVVERESNPFHIKAYRTSTVPFMSDYNSLASPRHRLVFDPASTEAPRWEPNNPADPLDPDRSPLFWLAWTDARNMRGQLYTAAIDTALPYTRTPDSSAAVRADEDRQRDDPPAPLPDDGETLAANAVEDENPGAGFCAPVGNPGAGSVFVSINNRTKDADIYGARIENEASAWSLNPSKTLGTIQRSYTIVAENQGVAARSFRFEIVNQPTGFPDVARASWDQLPFDPADAAFALTPPDTVEVEPVGPQSSVSVALFVVSQAPLNPVTVRVFDDVTDELVDTVTVNGAVEAGPLLNPDFTLNDFEIHNPAVFAPDQFNPDQFNPDQYNPDQFNPDLYNPDQYNPDQFNPDQYNPDQFNPDLFNPDQFNPDQFNPDLFNPDQFNTALTDSETLDNPDIPDPDLTGVARDAGGTVVKLDVTFGVQNTGNTLTPYTVDFAVVDDEVLDLLANQEIAVQLIAWQDKQVSDVQFCEPRIATENRIVSAVNNPNLFTLLVPDISQNRLGSLTYFIAPGDILQNTLRFIGPRDKIQVLAEKLPNDIISWAFTSQAANTGETELVDAREQVVNDRTPATFNFSDGDTAAFEAEGPGGAVVPADLVQAFKGMDPVPVDCVPALGSTVGLDIFNVPAGPTPLTCSATTANGVVSEVTLFVSVVDSGAPVIDPTTVPAAITAEASGAAGAVVIYDLPVAADDNGVDPDVDVACIPASGEAFPYAPPGPTTTPVQCVATDDSGNTDTVTFSVTVTDTTPPVLSLIGDAVITLQLNSGPYVDPGATAVDAVDGDVSNDVIVDASEVDVGTRGTYTVHLSVADSSGNSAGTTRTVIVEGFLYAGVTGIRPAKTNPNQGSSNPLYWAWLGEDGRNADSSSDTQLLRIEVCSSGEIVLQMAGDPGTSGFRYMSDDSWKFNWTVEGRKGELYCAVVRSSRSGQEQRSPPMRVK